MKRVLWHTHIHRCGLSLLEWDITVAWYWSPGTINIKPLHLSVCCSAVCLPLKRTQNEWLYVHVLIHLHHIVCPVFARQSPAASDCKVFVQLYPLLFISLLLFHCWCSLPLCFSCLTLWNPTHTAKVYDSVHTHQIWSLREGKRRKKKTGYRFLHNIAFFPK